jgi:exosome complex component RRP4
VDAVRFSRGKLLGVRLTCYPSGHGTYIKDPSTIVSSVSGTLVKTNRLLSVQTLAPLAPYVPEIGDMVIGRIIEVQSKRWKVDINATLSATLMLSSINLPGGILRRRTNADELQIRTFFSEGDLLVAEVQQLYQDGMASLHTRSMKFGKLRNGWFFKVPAGGILRSKSHVWTISAAGGAGDIDVLLGVNGYLWISKRSETMGPVDSIRTDEVSEELYSSKNEYISPKLRREIARLGNCVKAIVSEGYRVDEGLLNAVYEATCELIIDYEEDVETGPDWASTVVSNGLQRLGR